MVNIDLLERLYQSYGFEVSRETNVVSVFIYQKSRYFGVDIIITDDNSESRKRAEECKEKYSTIGYAVNIRPIKNNEEAEVELFRSFFSYENTVERSNRKYSEFVKKQTKNLFDIEYQYVESPFEIQNNHLESYRIFDIINECFNSSRAELIIIEAAAGYGKTCTAYEIFNKVNSNAINQLPMYTELARNRSAKIFKYILLDEINVEYPSLNYELVTKEIKNGRIPLIIDGFDELLVKVESETLTNDSFEEVESMLDTIGNLLDFKTKIVLTTRRTAIFTGIEFENWLNKWNNKFHSTRIVIREPRLKDWLGAAKYSIVQEKAIPIENLANPVILTFLKSIKMEEYLTLIDNPEMLVNQYFTKMLERERIRQNLIIPVEKQMDIFRNVVKMMIELDTNVEDKEFIKEIILDQNKKQIEYYRGLYNPTQRPTLDGLVDTLANHALLDRKGREQNQIGFINDFVFGTFIGQIIVETAVDKIEKEYSAYMIELAVTAFRVQNSKNRGLLWEKIRHVRHKFQNSTLFTLDIYLKSGPQSNYSEISVMDLTLYNINFTEFDIDSSVLINCRFKNCRFNSSNLVNTSFINCVFDSCSVVDNNYIDGKNGNTAIKCSQENCSILIEESINYEDGKPEIVNEFEREVLQRLWSISTTKSHHIIKLIQSFGEQNRRKVNEALKRLQEKNYINISGFFVRFELNKIHTIKEILEIKNEIPT